MMNRLDTAFEKMREAGEKAFIPFLVAGDPDPATFSRLVERIEPHADIIELGIPYTDPIADGPVIQAADARALGSGTTFSKALDLIAHVREGTDKPIVILTYANVIGVDTGMMAATLARFSGAGVDGIIVADVPIEEARQLIPEMEQAGMALISLVAPTTTDERLAMIVKNAKGFLYLVAVKGVTGARAMILDETTTLIQRVVKVLGKTRNIPVCVGFGISKPEHVQEIIKLGGDGVIVGSAIIDIIGQNLGDPDTMIELVEAYVTTLKDATRTT